MVELSSNIEDIFIKFECTVVLSSNMSRLRGGVTGEGVAACSGKEGVVDCT